MSLPEVPSYLEFASRVSLHTLDEDAGETHHRTASTKIVANDQAPLILDLADQALKAARKDWEAISKSKAETAGSIGCEDWWRTSVKDIFRACISANIMIATSKKALSKAASRDVSDILKVEVVKSSELYHAWWMVPKISAK